MMDSNAIKMDTATLVKFSKIFLKHQILWHNKHKYWSWDRKSFQEAFTELCETFPIVKCDLNEVRLIYNKFRDNHLSTLVKMVVSFTKMTLDAFDTLQQAPEWLWWLRKAMLEMPIEHNVFKITEFQMKFANSMWQVMVKMYGITEPSSGECVNKAAISGPSVASSDVNLNCENRTMRVDTEISIEHIDCTPLECLMKEYNITKERLQEIWCGWREVILAKLSAMSRGDLKMCPLRSVDWSLVDQLLLFDSQVPTLIQEDFEPMVKSLKILFYLVTKHQVEECDPMERRSRWDMLHREYNSSNSVGHLASCVLLQRWWYELKLSTQRAFRKLWQSLRNNGKHKDKPLPESLQCDIALRYHHVVTEELPSWTELVRSGGVVVLMESGGTGKNGDSTKGGQDQPSVQPIVENNTVLHNETVNTEKTKNSAQSLLDFFNKVNPAEVKTEIIFESDDEDTISGNNTDDNNDNVMITTKVNEGDDYCSVGFNDEGLPTLGTAYGEDKQNPCNDMNASGKSNYVFSKRLFKNLIKIINSKNPKYHSRIKFERKKRRNPSSSSNSDSDSDSDSSSDNESHVDVSDCSNRSKDADSKYFSNQLIMDSKVVLTRLDDISVWREYSYTTIVDKYQLHKIHLNSKVLSGLICSNSKTNYNRLERKRKLKRITGSNKRKKIDSESSVEEVKCLDDKLDNSKEEKNGRVAKKIKLQDIDEIRRINRDILTAQVAPMNVNKAQTAEDSSNKNVDESTNKTSINEPKIVNVDPTLGNTSKQNYIDLTEDGCRQTDEKPNIGYLLCGGDTGDILRFLSRKKEGVKKNGKAPSVRALLKLVEYFNVLYRRRLPSCCQARRARSIVLARRRILARKNRTQYALTYRRFAHQHKILHGKNECTCCCKQLLIETPTPSEKKYLAVLYSIGSILGDAANGGVPLSQNGTFKTLSDFTKTFSNTKNITILDNKDSKESKGPIVEPPKEINDKTPVDSNEIVKEDQSSPRPVVSEKNIEKQKVNHNNADVQKSSNKLDTTNKSFEESYNDWVTEKNKCNLLFGYKARNITNKNTANESKVTQSNANSKSSVEYQTIDNSNIIVNDVDSPIQTTKMTYEIAPTKTNTLENQQEINETTTVTVEKIRAGILKSLQNIVKNSKRELIHELLIKDFQVPLYRSGNKIEKKSNGEISENEAVNSTKSTNDTLGATRKLETQSSDPKLTDKIPTTRLKVRSLEELTGMKPMITDLARSDESKKKKSVEQQLNTVDTEVINKLQPYTIISDPTVSNNYMSQFNNGAPQLIFVPKTLNFEANQPSTSTQSGQNEIINNCLDSIKISDVMSLKDFNGLSKAPPMSPGQYIVGKDLTKLNILCMDVSQPAWKVGGDYLMVTYTPHIFENLQFYTMCPGAQAELIVDPRTAFLEDESGRLFSAPEQIVIEGGRVLQKIISSPLVYASVLFVVPSVAQCRRLLPMSECVMFVYGLRDGELHQVRRVRSEKNCHMVYCRRREALAALVAELNLNKVIQIDDSD